MHRRRYLAGVGSLVALAGCSISGSSGDSGASVGDSHSINSLKVSLTDVAASESLEIGDETVQAASGNALVHVRLEAAAVDGKKPPLYLRDTLTLDADGRSHEPHAFAVGDRRGCPTDGQKYNGSAVATEQDAATGWLTFSAPQEHIGDLILVWDPAGYDSMAWELGLSRSDVETC